MTKMDVKLQMKNIKNTQKYDAYHFLDAEVENHCPDFLRRLLFSVTMNWITKNSFERTEFYYE